MPRHSSNKAIYTKRQQRLRVLLKNARKKADITQVQLSRRLGFHDSFVTKYELGQRQLGVFEFLDVTKALKLDPAEVLEKVKD